MTVDPDTAAARRDDEHGAHYFCSEHCAATFDNIPHTHEPKGSNP
jgi:Cu+-exporting ATPase